MNKRLGFGVIGVNPRIRRTILSGLAHSRGARLAAICSRDSQKAAETAAEFGCTGYTSLSAMLDDSSVEAVFVCTPHHLHPAMVLEALVAGKQVICEKPLALDIRDAEDMVAAAERGGLPCLVNFTYHSLGGHRLVARLLAEGTVGQLRHLHLTYWQARQGLPGAKPADALLDVGSHLLDLACWWSDAGDSGEICSLVSQEGGREGELLQPIWTAMARTERGGLVSIQADRVTAGWRNGMECLLVGEQGSIALTFDTDAVEVRRARFGDSQPEGTFRVVPVPAEFQVSYQDFPSYHVDRLAAALRGEVKFPDVRYGLRVQRLIASAQTSRREGRWVEIDR